MLEHLKDFTGVLHAETKKQKWIKFTSNEEQLFAGMYSKFILFGYKQKSNDDFWKPHREEILRTLEKVAAALDDSDKGYNEQWH